MKKNRVVVTGIGVVSPLGCDTNLLFNNLIKGKSNFSKPDNFKRNYSGNLVNISKVSGDYEQIVKKNKSETERSFLNYSILASRLALEDAGLYLDNTKNLDLHIGTSESYSFDNLDYLKLNRDKVNDYLKGKKLIDGVSKFSEELNIDGEIVFYPVACSGGNVAIATAAKKRKANIYAEIKGYNYCCDAFHLTTPDPSGIMASVSIQKALDMSRLLPQNISYISTTELAH
jgi:3-oxoacyl-[acyl-carrier-protein] synthase II